MLFLFSNLHSDALRKLLLSCSFDPYEYMFIFSEYLECVIILGDIYVMVWSFITLPYDLHKVAILLLTSKKKSDGNVDEYSDLVQLRYVPSI